METHDPNEPYDNENDLGKVRACQCGGIHLVIGSMSLHFTADDVDNLFDLTCSAKQMADTFRRREAKSRRSGKKRSSKGKLQGMMH